jgi:sugar lactone lactonase YvrE
MSSTESSTVITTFAGGPQSGRAVDVAQSPIALAVHGKLVYVADQHKHLVYRVDTSAGQQTVVAGIGLGGFSGDDGPAHEAELNMPAGLAVDSSGNLFIADTRNGRIRKVQTDDGTITTIAGIGPSGVGEDSFSGDGGKATEARLDLPTGLAVDGSGTVYVADSGNDRIRVIRADGTIATVAGSGEGSVDDGGLAIEARFVLPTGDPYGIAVDAVGNIYIPEPFNRRVRKVDAETGILTTIAGSGDLGSVLDSPFAAAVGPDGNVYIADSGNSSVLRVHGDGMISRVAGTDTAGFSGDGGPAPDAQLQNPCAVAVGADGDVFIGDQRNCRVRRVDSRTHRISTVAGNGPPLLTFISAEGLAVDQHDNVYLSDLFHRVCKIDGATGKFSVVAGSVVGFSGDGGPARDALLQTPWRLSVDAADNLYITDHGNRRVRKVDAQTGLISTVAGNGQLSDFFPGRLATRTPLRFHLGTCIDGAGNLYIADAGYHCVQKVNAETNKLSTVAGVIEFDDGTAGFSGDGGPAAKALLDSPAGVAVDPPGNLYIADTNNHRIRRVDSHSGVIITVAGGGDDDPGVEPKPATQVTLGRPVQLAFDHDGNVLVSDDERHQIVLVDLAAGTIRRVAGNGRAGFSGDGGPAAAASLRAPIGIAVDSAGRVLIADSGNQRLRGFEQQR